MWKWVAAMIVFLLFALMSTCFVGYRRLATASDRVVATMPGSPAHVFSLLSDRDSISAWLPIGAELAPGGRGVVAVGDTIRVTTPAAPGDTNRLQRQVWVVRSIDPPTALRVDAIEFNAAGAPRIAMTRTDSLAASGDSTTVVSTFIVVPTALNPDTAGRMAAATMRAADRLRLGAAKAQWRGQLGRIAAHLGVMPD